MKQKKLICLLDALAAEGGRGVADFKRYLKLPATQSTRLVSLLDYLDKAKTEEELNEIAIFRKVISPSQDFDEKKVRNLFSALTGLLEEFIEIKSLLQKTSLRKRLLAEYVQKQQLGGQFLKAARESITKNLPEHELERHTELWLGNRLLYFHPKANLHEEVEFDQTLEDWHYNLNVLHAIETLKYCCEAVVLNKIYGKELAADFYTYFPSYIKILRPKTRQAPLVRAYIKAATFYLSPSLVHYLAFKEHLLPRLDSFKSERGALLIYLINSLKEIQFPGNKMEEFFRLIKIGVEKGLFVEKGAISPNYFNNIVYVACNMKAFSWVETFIKTYSCYLVDKKKTKENTLHLNQCILNFAKGNYQKVLIDIQCIRFEDYNYAVRKFTMELKCIYELEGSAGIEKINQVARNFKDFLRRKYKAKQISIDNKTRIENFITLLQKITVCPYKEFKKETIFTQLESYQGQIIEQNWLIEKLEAL